MTSHKVNDMTEVIKFDEAEHGRLTCCCAFFLSRLAVSVSTLLTRSLHENRFHIRVGELEKLVKSACSLLLVSSWDLWQISHTNHVMQVWHEQVKLTLRLCDVTFIEVARFLSKWI